jgi:hypothetical protein
MYQTCKGPNDNEIPSNGWSHRRHNMFLENAGQALSAQECLPHVSIRGIIRSFGLTLLIQCLRETLWVFHVHSEWQFSRADS